MKKIFTLWHFFFIALSVHSQEPATVAIANDQIITEYVPQEILKGDYALVAGGSKGIGFAIAEALAKRNYNLILVARGKDSLDAAKSRLESSYPIHVEVLSYDLSKEGVAEELAAWCTKREIHLKMLCNVAGYGGVRDFPDLPFDTLSYMINLNIGSCMAMTYSFLPLLEKHAPSQIMNVSSMAGFAPIPKKNLYSATKSAVIFFSYSLRHQLRPKKISVSCLAPGPVFTKPSIEKDTRDNLGWIGVQMAIPVERVGEIAVRKTLNRRAMIIPGTLNKFFAGVIRVMPRRAVTWIYSKI